MPVSSAALGGQQDVERPAHHRVALVGRRDAFQAEPEVDAGAVECLVVGEERVDLVIGIRVPALGAGFARVLVGVPILVGQRGPVVLADRVGFDELEVLPTLAPKTPTGDRRAGRVAHYRTRVLPYPGRPNWDLLATV